MAALHMAARSPLLNTGHLLGSTCGCPLCRSWGAGLTRMSLPQPPMAQAQEAQSTGQTHLLTTTSIPASASCCSTSGLLQQRRVHGSESILASA